LDAAPAAPRPTLRSSAAALDRLTEEPVVFFGDGAVVERKEAFAALTTSSRRR
jgi:hypothetical protein